MVLFKLYIMQTYKVINDGKGALADTILYLVYLINGNKSDVIYAYDDSIYPANHHLG